MIATDASELTYAAYQERQHREVTREGLFLRAARLSGTDKFRRVDGHWQSRPYVGHAVVSMLAGVPENEALQLRLEACQQALVGELADPALLFPLPPASFHQTVANTLSGEAHQRLVVERDLARVYPRRVTDVFSEFTPPLAMDPLRMRMIGLALFGSALGVLGVFEHEGYFRRILLFRDQFYGHPLIRDMGVRRTRPFIGHITLAYVGESPDDGQRRQLVNALDRLNAEYFPCAGDFILRQAELRAYDHLAEFRALPGLAQYPL